MQKSKIDIFKDFLFLRAQNKQISEPWNYAIGQISHESRFFHLQSEYASEVRRVLKELKITIELLKDPSVYKTDNLNNVEITDLILYFQGIFLHLTHQMKDKILKLIYFLMEGEETTEEFEKLICQNDLSLARLLKDKGDEIKKAGLSDLLEVWNQDLKTDSGINVCLRKRTDYHHRLSSLHLRKTLQYYEMAKIFLNTPTQLSDYGKQYFAELKEKSFKKWHDEAIIFSQKTFTEIENNIHSIIDVLMKYYNFVPYTEEEIAAFANKYSMMIDSFEVKNETSKSNIPPDMLALISTDISNLPLLKGNIQSIYIVGSVPRGNHDSRWSDMNIVIVMSEGCHIDLIKQTHKKILEDKPELNVLFIEKDEFLNDSPASRKLRFICHADGIVVNGEDLIKKEKFPNAGMDLALLLNFDLPNDVNTYENWLKENLNPSESEIRRKSLEVAKRTIDFLFGVAITNRPFYTSNREKRIEHIDKAFPKNTKVTAQYKGVLYAGGVRTLDELKLLIEVLKDKGDLLKDMQKTREKIGVKSKK